MNPDDPPRPVDPGHPARRRKLRLGILLGLLVLVVALNIAGLKVFVPPERLQVGVVNWTNRPMRNVRIEHEGRELLLGTVDAYDRVESRISTLWDGKVRLSFDAPRSDGQPDQQFEWEVAHRWEPGDTSIRFELRTSGSSIILNDKLDIGIEGSTRALPGKQP